MTPEQIERSRKGEALERAADILDGNPNGVPFEQELALRSVAGILRCEAAKLRERRGGPNRPGVAPWRDFEGGPIREGDVLRHPSGQAGIVVYHPDRELETDQWTVRYADQIESRLVLQIGEKGRGSVVSDWKPHADQSSETFDPDNYSHPLDKELARRVGGALGYHRKGGPQ